MSFKFVDVGISGSQSVKIVIADHFEIETCDSDVAENWYFLSFGFVNPFLIRIFYRYNE